MLYVLLDKETDAPLGAVDISSAELSNYQSKYTIIEANETFRGKLSYEIKYENEEIRLATQQEIDTYLANDASTTATQRKNELKSQVLDALGLDEADLTTLKNMIETEQGQ